MTILNPQSINPTFQTILARFIMCACHNDPFASQTIEVATVDKMEEMAADMVNAQGVLRANHKVVTLRGVQNKSVTLSHNGANLRVQVAKPTKHTNVTPTSKEAYHSLDLGDKCKEMAVYAIAVMETYGHCTDMMIARHSAGKIQSNLVSARRADIEKAGGIAIDGTVHVIEMTGETAKDPVTGRSANTWKIKRLNEPSPVGEQISFGF